MERTKAQDYMNRMYHACGTKLIEDGLYGGRDGHLRLAREIGASLPDFTPKEQKDIIAGSYSTIYVRACNLRPILDAKEWIGAMLVGQKEMEKWRSEKAQFYDMESPDDGYER